MVSVSAMSVAIVTLWVKMLSSDYQVGLQTILEALNQQHSKETSIPHNYYPSEVYCDTLPHVWVECMVDYSGRVWLFSGAWYGVPDSCRVLECTDHLLSYDGPPAPTLLAASSSSCPVGVWIILVQIWILSAAEFISSTLLDLTSNISHSV